MEAKPSEVSNKLERCVDERQKRWREFQQSRCSLVDSGGYDSEIEDRSTIHNQREPWELENLRSNARKLECQDRGKVDYTWRPQLE